MNDYPAVYIPRIVEDMKREEGRRDLFELQLRMATRMSPEAFEKFYDSVAERAGIDDDALDLEDDSADLAGLRAIIAKQGTGV